MHADTRVLPAGGQENRYNSQCFIVVLRDHSERQYYRSCGKALKHWGLLGTADEPASPPLQGRRDHSLLPTFNDRSFTPVRYQEMFRLSIGFQTVEVTDGS
jgi:hypothetical protein